MTRRAPVKLIRPAKLRRPTLTTRLTPLPFTCAGTNAGRTGPPVGRGTRPVRNTNPTPRGCVVAGKYGPASGAPQPLRPPVGLRAVLMPGAASSCSSRTAGRTLRISCEAVPPSVQPTGAQGGTSTRRTSAALSFVSCIRLLDGAPGAPISCRWRISAIFLLHLISSRLLQHISF
jgi:hypothetical protein